MTDTIIDYITGEKVGNAGAEENRQRVERFLVEKKGYSREEIRVDQPIRVIVDNQPYSSSIDLVVFCGPSPFMAIRCAAGSIGSYEREILAGARLVFDHQIPFSVSTDGNDALIRNVITGKTAGQGMEAIPSRLDAESALSSLVPESFPDNKKEREMIIFRSFTMDRQHKPLSVQ
ncbi:MAG: type I restriction enzyme HsdR N-terminal domain-containing protein [Pseudomonadota bacterium]